MYTPTRTRIHTDAEHAFVTKHASMYLLYACSHRAKGLGCSCCFQPTKLARERTQLLNLADGSTGEDDLTNA